MKQLLFTLPSVGRRWHRPPIIHRPLASGSGLSATTKAKCLRIISPFLAAACALASASCGTALRQFALEREACGSGSDIYTQECVRQFRSRQLAEARQWQQDSLALDDAVARKCATDGRCRESELRAAMNHYSRAARVCNAAVTVNYERVCRSRVAVWADAERLLAEAEASPPRPPAPDLALNSSTAMILAYAVRDGVSLESLDRDDPGYGSIRLTGGTTGGCVFLSAGGSALTRFDPDDIKNTPFLEALMRLRDSGDAILIPNADLEIRYRLSGQGLARAQALSALDLRLAKAYLAGARSAAEKSWRCSRRPE